MKFKRRMKVPKRSLKESIFYQAIAIIFIVMAVGMFPSTMFDTVNGIDPKPFAIPMIVLSIIGVIMFLLTKFPEIINPIDGLLTIALIWVTTIVCGSIPFIISGMDLSDSLFESASGITTTGATIMTDIESHSPGLLLWRSMMQWIGGILIIFLFLFILPMIGFGSRTLFGNEMSGSGSGNLSLRMKDAGRQFVKIYTGFTAVLVVILLILGLDIHESLCVSFSTISTGGFMSKNDSLASYSFAVKIVVSMFMFLGGTNFYLHYKAIYQKKPQSYLHNEEFLVMATIILVATIVGVWMIDGNSFDLSIDEFANVLLNVTSASTTTGFVASDYTHWYSPMVALLFMITIIGGSSGSTAGGLKIGRVMIIVKNAYNGLKLSLHPYAVYSVKIDKENVDRQAIVSAISVAMMFFLTLAVGTIILMFLGTDFQHSFTATLASITTFGPAVGSFGPMESYFFVSPGYKMVLVMLMILGRLEFLSAMIIFTPGFWKEFIMSRRKYISDSGEAAKSLFRR